MKKKQRDRVASIMNEAATLIANFRETHQDAIGELAETMAAALSRGAKILFFGNGGSAADAQHLASEFVNKLSRERPPLAAIALSTDSSNLTSIANDRGFRHVFSRQIEALGRAGDVAFAISTSGESENVILAIETAREMGMITAALLGRDGGRAASLAEHRLIVPHAQTQRIQEVHILTGHILAELVEEIVFAGDLDVVRK